MLGSVRNTKHEKNLREGAVTQVFFVQFVRRQYSLAEALLIRPALRVQECSLLVSNQWQPSRLEYLHQLPTWIDPGSELR